MPIRALPAAGLRGRLALLVASCVTSACSGGRPAAAPSPTPAPAVAATDVAAQARATREACAALIEREDAELVDFLNFTRPAEGVWDASARVRRGATLTRVSCRYDVAAARAQLFDAASPPPLPAASATSAAGGSAPASPGAPAASRPAGTTAGGAAPSAPATTGTPPATAAPAAPAASSAPPAPPAKRLAQDLSWVPDSTARANIARTRDACLAEAKRRKLTIESIDSFQREAGSASRWEATMTSLKRGAVQVHPCTHDLATGRTTLK